MLGTIWFRTHASMGLQGEEEDEEEVTNGQFVTILVCIRFLGLYLIIDNNCLTLVVCVMFLGGLCIVLWLFIVLWLYCVMRFCIVL
jgi:hypothetical protein